jgi:predicted amidophosphoribosyltransferase
MAKTEALRDAHFVATVIDALLELSLGRRCLSCGEAGEAWCVQCLRDSLSVHRVRTPSGRMVVAASRYAGAVRQAVLAHKEHGQLALAAPLGRLLAAAVEAERQTALGREGVASQPGTIVPVPSSRAVVRSRGHDHARRLARACGDVLGVPVVAALGWSRAVADQAGLSIAGRRGNVASGMTVVRPERLRPPVWVIDDVTTSGATLDEAARALAHAGSAPAGLAVVAEVEARTALAGRGVLR